MRNWTILLEDTGRTHNINMHTFECLAVSKEEAISKMIIQRPEFANRHIQFIDSYCIHCLGSGGVQTGENEYSPCPCEARFICPECNGNGCEACNQTGEI